MSCWGDARGGLCAAVRGACLPGRRGRQAAQLRLAPRGCAGTGDISGAVLERSWYLAGCGKPWQQAAFGGEGRGSPGAGAALCHRLTLLLAQREASGSPPLAGGISYFITSRQDNLSNFAWKKSLTKSSRATIMPNETVIEFPFLLLSRLSLCWF